MWESSLSISFVYQFFPFHYNWSCKTLSIFFGAFLGFSFSVPLTERFVIRLDGVYNTRWSRDVFSWGLLGKLFSLWPFLLFTDVDLSLFLKRSISSVLRFPDFSRFAILLSPFLAVRFGISSLVVSDSTLFARLVSCNQALLSYASPSCSSCIALSLVGISSPLRRSSIASSEDSCPAKSQYRVHSFSSFILKILWWMLFSVRSTIFL